MIPTTTTSTSTTNNYSLSSLQSTNSTHPLLHNPLQTIPPKHPSLTTKSSRPSLKPLALPSTLSTTNGLKTSYNFQLVQYAPLKCRGRHTQGRIDRTYFSHSQSRQVPSFTVYASPVADPVVERYGGVEQQETTDEGGQHTLDSGGGGECIVSGQEYHFIDTAFPELRLVNSEPPVYVVDNFLSEKSCSTLIKAARQGKLRGLQYEDRILFNMEKARLGAIPAGLLCVAPLLLHHDWEATKLAAAVGMNTAVCLVALAAAWQLLPPLMLKFMGGRVFTGTKWTTDAHEIPLHVFEQFRKKVGSSRMGHGSSSSSSSNGSSSGGLNGQGHSSHRNGLFEVGNDGDMYRGHCFNKGGVQQQLEQEQQQQQVMVQRWQQQQQKQDFVSDLQMQSAVVEYVSKIEALLDDSRDRLEVPTVSWYRKGEQQHKHQDARCPKSDSQGLQFIYQSTGQRLAQCLCYLNTLAPSQGGSTKFFHPALNGLQVQPRQGSLLVFFPAFLSLDVDKRMEHSGEVVVKGEKWVINSWMGSRAGQKWGQADDECK